MTRVERILSEDGRPGRQSWLEQFFMEPRLVLGAVVEWPAPSSNHG